MRTLLPLLLLTLIAPLFAQETKGPERWETEIAAIEERDAKAPPAKGGVVFVGSSSIRLWDLDKSFPELKAVNHGFGGSTIADSVHFVDRLVLKLEPRTIVFYAGDNDINAGLSPEQVHADFLAFIKAVHAKLPEAKIVYLPIKPSPKRFALLDKQEEANRRIEEKIDKDPQRLVYVDTVSPMLDDDGKPRRELFVKDELHLNEAGYALWTKLLAPHVEE